MNMHWDLRGTLTSLRFTVRPWGFDRHGFDMYYHDVSVLLLLLLLLLCYSACLLTPTMSADTSIHVPTLAAQLDQLAVAALLSMAASVFEWHWQQPCRLCDVALS